ncbi:uncharacterized protein LOC105429436 [Pogonomyrmex barbatus]|uniref:Uncharacterized protein LOC105429436 n=1 Tax=Pogonomyrmex barbatus TaxID=144034 RepID=A0A8N1S9H1_9HYME|nr:uncharacterized protein LOC105429436 [Pogonomyrmex barbatus]
MTFLVFHKLRILVNYDQWPSDQQEIKPQIPQEVPSLKIAQLQLNTQTPFVPYKNSVLEEIPRGILHLNIKSDFLIVSTIEKGIIEPLQDQS